MNTSTSAGGNDLAEVNREAVCKAQRLTCGKIRFDISLIHIRLALVVNEDHNDVSILRRVRSSHNLQAGRFCFCPALGAVVQTDNDIHAALMQVQCMRMTLRAVTDDRNGLAVELLKIAILLIENSVCHFYYLFLIINLDFDAV